ncbi:MAG: KH domain-containing protein [Parcubacteria group bacterium]|nr:KH domain-containing protein [Parcubacteria group bacterium]
MEQDAQFLEYVVKALVDNPGDVKIKRTVDEMGVLMNLDVNPADMGKIIGRMGNTAKAIRTLLRVVGMKNNARVNLKINEPEGSTRGENTPSASGESSAPSAPAESRAAKSVDEAMADLKI